MKSQGWDGEYTLVEEKNETPVSKGAVFSPGTIEGGKAPHKPSSTGSVYLKPDGDRHHHQYYPSVIGAKWKKV
jgi:hypothetical protein